MRTERETTDQHLPTPAHDWGGADETTLSRILHPFDARAFTDEWWSRRSLLVKGHHTKFDGLFSRHRFRTAVENAVLKSHVASFRLVKVVRDFEGSLSCTEPIESDEIERSFHNGDTICVNHISLGDETLARVCQAVKRRLGFTGTVRFNAYLSPDGSGADTHFDTSISTTLQIEGRKRWRYAASPAIPWPPSNAQLLRDGTRQWTLPWIGSEPWQELPPVDRSTFAEVVLEPGDLLCLPAGTWHSAKAIGESLALNMAFAPLDAFTVFIRMLEQRFAFMPEWRAGTPTSLERAEAEKLPVAVEHYLSERASELAQYFTDFAAADQSVQAVWRSLVNK